MGFKILPIIGKKFESQLSKMQKVQRYSSLKLEILISLEPTILIYSFKTCWKQHMGWN